jgi:uroporphyrinogen decarboxylase
MNLFNAALARENSGRPPVWFMRQAGRYHSHYQKLKERHSFIELCKNPGLARETTMGPIRDFDFDAAILFSDLLFPLEAMGMGLEYSPGPKLYWHLKSKADLAKLGGGASLVSRLEFQAEAMRLIRAELPASKGLLGFVGGPLTLYCYAVEGSHSGELASAKAGFADGRYDGFVERLLDLLAENMALQAHSGADTVAVLDTCAGEVDLAVYRERVIPALKGVIDRFKKLCPGYPVTYYSKKTGPDHWRLVADLEVDAIGIDWNHDIAEVLAQWGGRFAIQGNVDPEWLFLEPRELERRLREVFGRVRALPERARCGWICGLGHGVIQKTPEENVRLFLRLQKEIFGGTWG